MKLKHEFSISMRSPVGILDDGTGVVTDPEVLTELKEADPEVLTELKQVMGWQPTLLTTVVIGLADIDLVYCPDVLRLG